MCSRVENDFTEKNVNHAQVYGLIQSLRGSGHVATYLLLERMSMIAGDRRQHINEPGTRRLQQQTVINCSLRRDHVIQHAADATQRQLKRDCEN